MLRGTFPGPCPAVCDGDGGCCRCRNVCAAVEMWLDSGDVQCGGGVDNGDRPPLPGECNVGLG